MIPAPPPDRALPGLAEALDGERMRGLLDRTLGGGEPRARVLACRPDYIRYKPGTSCLVGYDVRVACAGRGPASLPVHALLCAGDRAARLAAKPELATLADRAAPLAAGLRPLAPLPAIAALAQVYPLDRKLPALAAAASAGEMGRRLGLGPDGGLALDLVRYKPGRKAVLRYGPGPGRGEARYGKLHGYERRPEILAWTEWLRRAGLPTPAVAGWWPDLGLLLHEEAAGVPLKSLRGRAEQLTWMAPAAELLARLHGLGVPPTACPPARDEAGAAAAAAGAVAALLPGQAARARRLAAGVAAALASAGGPPGLVHGDFYDDQLLVSGAGLWLLDLDEHGIGQPLADLANHLAHLAVQGGETGAAREAFLAEYARHRPCPPAALAAHEAAALLCLAPGPFRHLRPDWPDAVAGILDLAEARLATGRQVPAGRPAGGVAAPPALPVDPALPQLAAVLDAGRVSRELSGARGGAPVRVASAHLVRHKPGRRAVLRYELGAGGEAPALYGKAFANERGAALLARTRRLVAAVAPGSVLLPRPLAYLADLRLLLSEALPGAPLGPAILAGDVAAARRVARAFHALHAAPVDLGRDHGWAEELAILVPRVARLSARAPELAARAEAWLAALAAGPPAAARRRVPVHRDFYPEQVLLDGERVAILDLDDAAMGDPVLDLANFRAHLTHLALAEPAAEPAVRRFSAAFLAAARRLDPGLDLAGLAFLEAATLLRLAEIHHGRPGAPPTARVLAAIAPAWRRAWARRPRP